MTFSEPFSQRQDVGTAAAHGATFYDPTAQAYTLSAQGREPVSAGEATHFAGTTRRGDFILQATAQFVPGLADEHSTLGLIARDSVTGSSRYVALCVGTGPETTVRHCATAGGPVRQVSLSSFHPTELQLSRQGNRFTLSAAVFGEAYKSSTVELSLNEELSVGLFVSTTQSGRSTQGVFHNVRVITPAKEGFKPYEDYLGSYLEVMDVTSGRRRIVHTDPGSIQAPNWTPNHQLLFNSAEGVMYQFDLTSSNVTELNTGPRRQNNNDHVLSFDGKWLALSNYAGEPPRSVAFILPVEGSSEPKQITSPEAGHTYLHGWSPDGRRLVFTGGRQGETGDYRNLWAVDVETGQETALTPPGTLDDGPEYTPDGRYIYFNSVRTGTMQIWRMGPDGEQPEQVTFDEYNNWFPHISPDGRWIVYLAFPRDMDPWSHPFYRQCMIRLMPASGGAPRSIGYLYGGQGSMNTPGWSPDSTQIAFVSNCGALR